MPHVAAVTWQASPGAEGRIEEILAEMVRLTRLEPGCLVYQVHRSLERSGLYFIYEQFADEAAFKRHIQADYYQRLVLGEAVNLLDGRERSLHTTAELD